MTSKEALERLVKQANAIKLSNGSVVNRWDYEKLLELVERDTPMKVIENRVTDFNTHNQWGVLHCPKCSYVVVHSTYQMPQILPNYCSHCGQKLDWSDDK